MLHRSSESLTVASLTSKARRVRGSLFHARRPLSLHLLLQAGSPLVILPSRAREKKAPTQLWCPHLPSSQALFKMTWSSKGNLQIQKVERAKKHRKHLARMKTGGGRSMGGMKVRKMRYPHAVLLFINSLTLRTNESQIRSPKNAGPEKIIKTHGEPSFNTATSDTGWLE